GTDLNHTLRIDLAGTTAGGLNDLLGPGGVPLRDVNPPKGDGVSSASARGGSGGFVDVSVPTAHADFTANVQAYVDANRILAGGDVSIISLSAGAVSTYSNSAAGGFIQVGVVNSTIDYRTTSNAYVGHAAPGVSIPGITGENTTIDYDP